MAGEWTSEERFWAAVNLEKPDRAPIATLMTTPATGTLLGMEHSRPLYEDWEAMYQADQEVFDRYGGWDCVNPMVPAEEFWTICLETKLPEPGSLDIQTFEKERLRAEDYEKIIEMGSWSKFRAGEVIFRGMPWTPAEAVQWEERMDQLNLRQKAACEAKGAVYLYPEETSQPFFQFSLARSMLKFTEDLYYRPDIVEKALAIATDEYIITQIKKCKECGMRVSNCTEERASTFFYPLHIFERFWWPNFKKIIDALWSEGIVVWAHLDTPWDKNLPYFKQLPKGSVIVDLDGTTDVFAAKELLRGHMCISSDVSAALFALGEPTDVEAYVKRLIDEVGGDGGHILNVGCNLPAAVKVENFKTYLNTGKTYKGKSSRAGRPSSLGSRSPSVERKG